MAEAVLIDYLVINGQGIDFWSHYCVSVAYWFLIPSYFSLWLGGSWLAKHQAGLRLQTLGMAAVALAVSWAACYLVSNGSFYWLSNSVPLPRSAAAWSANLRRLVPAVPADHGLVCRPRCCRACAGHPGRTRAASR